MPKNKNSDFFGYFDYGYIKFHKHKKKQRIKKKQNMKEKISVRILKFFLIKIGLL